MVPITVHGVDFTSAPSRRKPIRVASGHVDRSSLSTPWLLFVARLESLETFEAFDGWLERPGPWIGGFDLPFGLPRALLIERGWLEPGDDWAAVVRRVGAIDRPRFIQHLRDYCAPRPAGSRFAHRATDGPAGSSPSMKWVNPPVARMWHSAAPRLLQAGLLLPRLHEAGDPLRVGLEAYPGMLARGIAGRQSYKSDDRRRDDASRRACRERIVEALGQGCHPMAIAVVMEEAVREACVSDGSGDSLDAVLCQVQAAWGWLRRADGYGFPPEVDPLEGWIVGAVPEAQRDRSSVLSTLP